MLFLKSCFYDLDTGKLEMVDVDGIRYSVDVYAVEDLCADTMYERSALDYLLYNEPMKYVNLLLTGELREYVHDHPIY
ncbi:MAG: hypothetical protein IJK64_09890, partial [Clostridia bacterium]|nr:hypothetical protein [Clostridia bacterium]